MGETRVDLLHLLQDLADAYPGDLHETILVEIIANALDSGASVIRVVTHAAARTVTVVDNGTGMRRADLRRYHDVATSAKTRGDGIGFAGVGIKLGLLVSDEVITESRRGKEHISTTWTMSNRKRAPWHWIDPAGLVTEQGTAVRLRLTNALSPLLDAGFAETTVRQHFEPLFNPFFDELLKKHYSNGVRFEIDGVMLERDSVDGPGVAPIAVRLAGKRKPSAVGFLIRRSDSFDEDRRGVAISTFGKVIKRGWDWLGMMPAAAERTSGLIEAPELAASLTLNKADFLRTGPRGAVFLAYRKALQEACAEQLARWGDDEGAETSQRRRVARPIERDMESVLADLADDFPMLAMLVHRQAGGTRSQRVGKGGEGALDPQTMDLFASPPLPEETAELPPDGGPPEPSPRAEPPRESPDRPSPDVGLPEARGRRRPTRLGLSIQFESREKDSELARLVETTIWVNDAHPAFRRASASRSEAYHIALSVALALGKIAVERSQEREFVLEFMVRWGEARETPRGRKRVR
jgi:hypothetical protein